MKILIIFFSNKNILTLRVGETDFVLRRAHNKEMNYPLADPRRRSRRASRRAMEAKKGAVVAEERRGGGSPTNACADKQTPSATDRSRCGKSGAGGAGGDSLGEDPVLNPEAPNPASKILEVPLFSRSGPPG
ncbi:hypothetical protein HPP92_019578 [Vanilla planifolia]|uniref:Uncharacterized protein n=1 Tax=Vanilla planifolia TaxID=51239 RepID=A0A835UHP4_VANPL|nr:hypothetical protein HPP92_019578 [Vanilla planifolia]